MMRFTQVMEEVYHDGNFVLTSSIKPSWGWSKDKIFEGTKKLLYKHK
jgi:hypothetical protein